MKYFYEYKFKDGATVGGHNLEEIQQYKDIIILKGVDILPTYNDYEYSHWVIQLDMSDIEYLKIEPMLEKEND